MNGEMKRIAVSVEHVRGWGRRVCEGIASFARGCPDWTLTMFEDGVPDKRELSRYDGFIWCIDDVRTARRLVGTGRPVIDLFCGDAKCPGTVSVGANHVTCGQLAAALVYVRDNVAKGLIASDVAKHVGMSYVSVEKAFKRKLGTTIQKEIMASRLETAQHLLAVTHRPLADIAKLSGFRSVQYLCLCFQKQFGRSPLAYRQKCLAC